MLNLFRFLKVRRESRHRTDRRPCKICGLAPKIKVREGLGQYCLYYGIRIADDEASDTNNWVRKICLQDGNNFTWPVIGLKADELLEWRREHLDRHLRRKALIWGVAIGVASLVISMLGVVVEAYVNG